MTSSLTNAESLSQSDKRAIWLECFSWIKEDYHKRMGRIVVEQEALRRYPDPKEPTVVVADETSPTAPERDEHGKYAPFHAEWMRRDAEACLTSLATDRCDRNIEHAIRRARCTFDEYECAIFDLIQREMKWTVCNCKYTSKIAKEAQQGMGKD